MYFTQNLLEIWILGGNLVVDKTLRKLRKPTTSRNNHICYSWNDRRSRRVFLCFYSAIFQLTSAKFQTFAYNSRTVWSSYMKFGQQVESNKLYVCTKFEAIGHVTLVLEPENRPASLA